MVEMNGQGHPSSSITVLYKVANAGKEDAGHFNAFEMPRGSGITLASVKSHCTALNRINADGAEGYHWRVRVDEKTTSDGSGNSRVLAYSWWDIQDENAKLPVKEATLGQLASMFSPSAGSVSAGGGGSTADDMTKAATSAMKGLGKALNKVAGTVDHHHHSQSQDHGPRVSVIVFKLTKLGLMGSSRRGGGPVRRAAPAPAAPRQRPPQRPQRAAAAAPAPARAQQQQAPRAAPNGSRAQTAAASVPKVRPPTQRQPSDDLMGFGSAHSAASAGGAARAPPRHATSSPAAFNETRAQRLKREYEAKAQKANRVWDDVDQRWVEVDAKAGATVHRGNTSVPPGVATGAAAAAGAVAAKKEVGIKLDPNNARGKSANVQAAVNQRVNEMRSSQAKAVQEVRERELKKKQSEAEEDEVRRKLEPKIKVWSEEHGKKKQLRALLSSLHTILWEGAKWKPVSLGDILDANKCKRCYHKATLVVHPDKSGRLNPEQRFLAKRIFDALTQAKTEFDSQN